MQLKTVNIEKPETDAKGQQVVKQGRRQDDEVLTYANSNGYNLPTTGTQPVDRRAVQRSACAQPS